MRAKHLVDKQLELTKSENELKDTYNRVRYLERFETDYYTMKDKYNDLKSFLTSFLLAKTNYTYQEEKAIREQISTLLIANSEPIDSITLKGKYITSVKPTHLLKRSKIYPSDIEYGYYYFDENGNEQIDENMKILRMEVL